jgi:hypothetical protein
MPSVGIRSPDAPVAGPLTLQCSVGQADLAVGGDVRPFVLPCADDRYRLPERNWSGHAGLDFRGNLGCRVALGIGIEERGMLAAPSAEVAAAARYSGNLGTTVPDA